MTRAEKYLYHQIHPLKLFTDFATSFWSSWLLWERQPWAAMTLAFVPSMIASAIMIGLVDLAWLRDTYFGHYVARHMTRKIEALRFAGQIAMWTGAWWHLPWLLPLGLLVVLLAWANVLWAQRAT